MVANIAFLPVTKFFQNDLAYRMILFPDIDLYIKMLLDTLKNLQIIYFAHIENCSFHEV